MSLLASSAVMIEGAVSFFAAMSAAGTSAPSIELELQARTPESVTEPIETLRCTVQWVTGERSGFTVREIGRRGYRDPNSGEVVSTDEKVEFIDDPDNLFAGYKGWWPIRNGFEANSSSSTAKFGSRVALRFERTEFSPTRQPLEIRAVLVNSFQDWMPLVKGMGFCDVTYVLQEPLSLQDVAEVGKS